MGFEVAMDRGAGETIIENIVAKINTQFARGAACKIVQGHLELCAATDKMSHIYMGLETLPSQIRPATLDKSHATIPQEAETIPVQGRDILIISPLTGSSAPPINGTACNTNATTTQLLVTYTAGGDTNGDFDGGMVYCVELNQTRRIASSTFSGGVWTFVLDTPFTVGREGAAVALTTTHTIRALYWTKGSTAVKFVLTSSVPLSLDTSRGGKSGGQNKIEEVDLKGYSVTTSAPYLS